MSAESNALMKVTSLMKDVTYILSAIESGRATTADLLPLVYDELRRMASNRMQHGQPGHTLQPTALVHEAFLRLVGSNEKAGADVATWQSRRHFFGAAAIAMQRILVDNARKKKRLQHGGDRKQVQLSEIDVAQSASVDDVDLIALDEAFMALEATNPDKAELVRLRYFAGLNEQEVALAMNISRATASRWWTFAKAWLFAEMQGAEMSGTEDLNGPG